MKTTILCMALVLTTIACSKRHTISSLSISTSIVENTALSSGNEIILEIIAIDNDGISSITLDINALKVHDLYDNIIDNEWKMKRTFYLSKNTVRGKSEIVVTVKDMKGEINRKTSALFIR